MFLIINAVYRAIRGIKVAKGGNKEMGTEGRKKRTDKQIEWEQINGEK